MANLSRLTTWQTGDTLTASALNAEFSNLLDDYNGGITNANISGSAAIAGSKISGTAVTLNATETITGVKTFSGNNVFSGANSHSGVETFTAATKQVLKTDTDGSTITFDLNVANIHTVTLGGNRTLALSNPSTGQVFVINLVQDGSGSRTVTLWSTIKWSGGTAPTLTTTAGKTDTFGFICTSADNYLGYIVGQNL